MGTIRTKHNIIYFEFLCYINYASELQNTVLLYAIFTFCLQWSRNSFAVCTRLS